MVHTVWILPYVAGLSSCITIVVIKVVFSSELKLVAEYKKLVIDRLVFEKRN